MKKYHAKTIITPRLKIRMPKITDAEDMFNNWASDSEVTKYITWEPHPTVEVTRMILSMWINLDSSNKSIEWVIVDKASLKTIGSINVYRIDQSTKSCEIGFCLSQKYWNQGLMSEAVFYVLKHVFSIGIKSVMGSHIRENVASGKVMIKNHMRYSHSVEGTSNRLGDVIFDYYVVTVDDWKLKVR